MSARLLSKNLKIKSYKTIILPVVLYGCEAWSLTLRDECRLLVFDNRILRDENGEWRILHIQNFIVCTVYLIARVIKSKKLRWAGNVVRMEEDRRALKILTVTRKGSSGKPRRRREDNDRMDLEERYHYE